MAVSGRTDKRNMGSSPPITKIPSALNQSTGWPWDSEIPDTKDVENKANLWPGITVVTPSYNQGQFIEETIRSVLFQRYPNLEFFVMDGGSTDNTIEIIKYYEPWIDHWESQQDKGQSHAINKGWQRSTGSILAFLNSDDVYLPGALLQVAKAFKKAPLSASVSGVTRYASLSGETVATKSLRSFAPGHYLRGGLNPGQPSMFLARSTYETVGLVDESLHLSLDRDYWIRIGLKLPDAEHVQIAEELAVAKLWAGNNATLWSGSPQAGTMARKIHIEHLRILAKTFLSPDLPPSLKMVHRAAYAIEIMKYAQACLQSGNRKEALKQAMLSVLRYPLLIRRRGFWGLLKRIAIPS